MNQNCFDIMIKKLILEEMQKALNMLPNVEVSTSKTTTIHSKEVKVTMQKKLLMMPGNSLSDGWVR